MAILRFDDGSSERRTIRLDRERTVLGRDRLTCDVVLNQNAVSRQHAMIERTPDPNGGHQYWLVDMNSRNGTSINGRPLETRARLNHNDTIGICSLLASILLEPQDGRPGPSGMTAIVDDSSTSARVLATREVPRTRDEPSTITESPQARLAALLEISRVLAPTHSIDEMLPKTLDCLFEIFPRSDRGFILLGDGKQVSLTPRVVKQRGESAPATIHVSQTVIRRSLDSREAILSSDVTVDPRFEGSLSLAESRVRSMVCVPLVDREGESIGVIHLETSGGRAPFLQDDLDVLISVAGHVSLALEGAKLAAISRERWEIERDLALARKVQLGFLPSAPPQLERYEFFDYYEPARQVGGDYFDYIPLPGRRLAIIVADVSGKGMAAALVMAHLSADLRYILATEPTPSDALGRLNRLLCGTGWDERFVTLAMAVLELETRAAVGVIAGHMPIYRRSVDGRVDAIGWEARGLPLGVVEEAEFLPTSFTLAPGETFVMFTDGLTDAVGADQSRFGLDRTRERLGSAQGGPRAVGEHLLADVRQFAGSGPHADDLCLLCFGAK